MKKAIILCLFLAGCGSSPKDTDSLSALDEQLRYAVKNRCSFTLESAPMRRIAFSRRVNAVAVEICEQVKAGKRAFRDGWSFE